MEDEQVAALRRKYILFAVISSVVVGACVGAFLFRSQDARADIELRTHTGVILVSREDDAVEAASRVVGFPVKTIGKLPANVRMEYIETVVGPEGPLRPLNSAVVGYRGDRLSLDLVQYPVRLSGPANDDGEKLDLGLAEMEIWVTGTEPQVIYTGLTADRTFMLVVVSSEPFPLSQVAELFGSLRQP
jgi:hypothetical protein